MKVYYPVEFMAALLTFEAGQTEKVASTSTSAAGWASTSPRRTSTPATDFTPDYRDKQRRR
jgi:hypothetical protein